LNDHDNWEKYLRTGGKPVSLLHSRRTRRKT